MRSLPKSAASLLVIGALLLCSCQTRSPAPEHEFTVVAFSTGRADAAHVSFVNEANRWFADMGRAHHFRYRTTTNWGELNPETLARCQVVVFLDSRPEGAAEREAFRRYMERGGAWMGFHFAAFALTPSGVPQNWPWYHDQFLGAGEYAGNTWRPTPAVLRVEDPTHAATAGLPPRFRSSANEWYRWKQDLRTNADIRVLLSIDPSSFPLGTGPKPHEIWHAGDYPVVWTNRKYRMLYVNMGHNDLDYEHGTNRELSLTFGNPAQDQLILNALLWLGGRQANPPD